MKIIMLTVVLALSGCATRSNDWSWYKEGSNQREFNMDNGQCRAQAFGMPGASLFQVVMVQQSCMEGKGWEKRSNS